MLIIRKDINYKSIPYNQENINKYKSKDNLLKHARYIPGKTKGIILVNNNELVGYIAWESNIVIALEVTDNYKNKGVEKFLLNKAIENGIDELTVNKNNTKAINLYKLFGFKIYNENSKIYFMKREEKESLFSKNKDYEFIPLKNLIKEYPELIVFKRVEKRLIKLDLELTTEMLIVCENHPFTLVNDKEAKRLINERWLPSYIRPVIFGLDIDSNLVIDLRDNKFYIYNIDQPKKPKKSIKSIKEYINEIISLLKTWAKDSGRVTKNVIKIINDYKNLLYKELDKV